MKYLMLLLFVTFTFQAAAVDGQERGGGNFVGLEATTSAQAVLFEISQDQAMATRAHLNELQDLMKKVKVIGVPKDLSVQIQGVAQSSTAVNDKSTNMVQVNIALWNGLEDPRPRKALMLHELESLLGFESTGDYSISSAYLLSTGFAGTMSEVAIHPPGKSNAGFDFSQYGALFCDAGGCHVAVPLLTNQNKAVCESSFKVAYDELIRTGKLISNTIPCSDSQVISFPNRPDRVIHSGSFTGQIDFQ